MVKAAVAKRKMKREILIEWDRKSLEHSYMKKGK